MAKELPYFKFEPNEWETGNIQLLTHEEKGVFIDLCSMYWSRLGDMPYKLAKNKICGGNAVALQSLCEEGIIEIIDDSIYIAFLEEQLNEFKRVSKQNSENAKKRWSEKRKNKGKHTGAMRSHSERNAIREEKRREEEIREDNTLIGESEKIIEVEVEEYEPTSMRVADQLGIDPDEVNQIQNDFFNWFKAYDKNVGQQMAQREWSMLKQEEREKCLSVVSEYVQKTPKRWRKNPANYLSEKAFNDEIIDRTKNEKNGKSKFAESIEQAKRNYEEYQKNGFDF